MSTFRTSAVPASPSLALRRWWASNNLYVLFHIWYLTRPKQYLMVGIEKIAERHILNILYQIRIQTIFKVVFIHWLSSGKSTMVRALDPRGARQNGFYPHCKHKVFSQIFKEDKQYHDIEQKCKRVSQGSCIPRSAVEVVLLASLRCNSFKLNY